MEQKFAIVKINHTQYKVKKGDTIKVNKITGESGDKVTFDQVLLTSNKGKVAIGKPFIEKEAVTGQIISQERDAKVVKQTYKAKTRIRRKVGHRQFITLVKITKV